MLIKTKGVSSTGKKIYRNKLTGKYGTLGQHTFEPSERRSKRQRTKPIQKVTTNRKRTRGRKIYYQLIFQVKEVFDGFTTRHDKNGRKLAPKRKTKKEPVLVRTIKHNFSPYKK